MDIQTQSPQKKEHDYKIFIKVSIIIFLVVLLLIPTFMVQNLISERQDRRDTAIKEVTDKWASSQSIVGPIIAVPYKYNHNTIKYIHFLPKDLAIEGDINPQELKRGIFKIAAYRSSFLVSGSFDALDFEKFNIPKDRLFLDKAELIMGISDLRGIEKNVTLNWNNQPKNFQPGITNNELLSSGISAPIRISFTDSTSLQTEKSSFSLQLSCKGSESIYFSPVGGETTVNVNSTWSSPSFTGAFLPSKREVKESGFHAEWSVLELNRNFPQSWLGNKFNLRTASFGVDLISPNGHYQQSFRSVKYAILFIALTFLTIFLIDLLHHKNTHPLQYALTGLALCIFYILLVSISEHSNFFIAYLISTVMTTGMIFLYAWSIFKSIKLATLLSTLLLAIYGFIFIIIQLESYALLAGSLGLFLILALVMYFTKKIQWNQQR